MFSLTLAVENSTVWHLVGLKRQFSARLAGQLLISFSTSYPSSLISILLILRNIFINFQTPANAKLPQYGTELIDLLLYYVQVLRTWSLFLPEMVFIVLLVSSFHWFSTDLFFKKSLWFWIFERIMFFHFDIKKLSIEIQQPPAFPRNIPTNLIN